MNTGVDDDIHPSGIVMVCGYWSLQHSRIPFLLCIFGTALKVLTFSPLLLG